MNIQNKVDVILERHKLGDPALDPSLAELDTQDLRDWFALHHFLGDFSQASKEKCIASIREWLILDRAVKRVF